MRKDAAVPAYDGKPSGSSGVVVAVNNALADAPEKVNEDAFGAWIIKVEMSLPSELDKLMDAAAYKAFIGE